MSPKNKTSIILLATLLLASAAAQAHTILRRQPRLRRRLRAYYGTTSWPRV
jgi:hypothetical protein